MIDFTRLDDVQRRRPLIHCISNIVSAADCANVALAVGASPMMAQGPAEMAAVSAACSATVLNTGTPDDEKFRLCLLCGQEAAAQDRPIVLDPVGVGANRWRLQSVQALLHRFTPAILRVNPGEALALLGEDAREQGVDSLADIGADRRLEIARALAKRRRTTVLLSGPEDFITDGETAWRAAGGSPWTARVTGTGCMLSVLCGVFAAVEPDHVSAAALAAAFWKTCARRAEETAGNKGPGSFHIALLDAAGTLTAADFAREADLTQG